MSAPPRPNLRQTLPEILTPGEVLALLRLSPNQLRRRDRQLKPGRTPFGHRRYRRDPVVDLYEARQQGRAR